MAEKNKGKTQLEATVSSTEKKKKITEEDGREEVGKASYGVTVFLLLPHAANFRLSS